MSQDPSMAEMSKATGPQRPDDEDLTAFAEGRLEGAMRQAVLDRLAVDEDYYELYGEILRFQDEEADLFQESAAEEATAADVEEPEAGEPAKVLSSPRWWRRPAVLGLAAAALLAVLIAPRLLVRAPTVDRLVEGLQPDPEILQVAPGPTYRFGGPTLPVIEEFDQGWSFLFGALVADAEVAATLPDDKLDRDPAVELDRLAERDLVLNVSWSYCQGPLSTCAEQVVEDKAVDGFSMRYGAWCRAVWLALKAGDEGYLSSPAVASGIRALVKDAPEGAREDVLELRERWSQRDLEALQDKIETVAEDRRAKFRVLPDFEELLELD